MKGILAFLILQFIYSQSSILEEIKNDPIKRAKVLKSVGVAPDSKFIEAAFGKPKDKEAIPDVIINHQIIQKGNPLPDPEELRKLYHFSESENAKMKEYDLKILNERKNKPEYKSPELPRCTESKSEIYGTYIKENQKVQFDITYIDPQDVSKSSQLKNSNIKIYKHNSEDGASIAAIVMGVMCLPTRFIATQNYGEMLTGDKVFEIK